MLDIDGVDKLCDGPHDAEMIYFIEAVGSDAVTLVVCGGERELTARLAALQAANPSKLRSLGAIRGGSPAPVAKALEGHKLNGNWFKLSAPVRSQIKGWVGGKPVVGAPAHPGYRPIKMTAMVEAVPKDAMAVILAAVKRAGGDLKKAAEDKELDCTWRTLYRWIDRLDKVHNQPIKAELKKLMPKAAAASAS